ncbi:MAG: serine hydrolase domain-containing protein [Polyangiales bacterium]
MVHAFGRLLLIVAPLASLALACVDTPDPMDAGLGDVADVAPPRSEEEITDRLFFESQMREGRLPGLAVAVVGPEGILWSSTYGVSDVATGELVQEDTLFGVASVSKLVVGLLLMQSVEAGELALGDDAEQHLSHTLSHPLHPNEAMSVRSLATHTSGIRDSLSLFVRGFVDGDPEEDLGVFTRSYVEDGGGFYSSENFGEEAPGASYAYANMGFALLGHALEGATGRDFRSLSATLLESLSMDGRFFLADVDPARLSVSYGAGVDSYDSVQTGTLYYPAGGLMGSLEDMSRLLRVFMNDGELDGVRVVEPESVALMEQVANPSLNARRGVSMNSTLIEGVSMHGHNGAGVGSSADVWYGPDFGVVVLSNSNAYVRRRLGDDTGSDTMSAIRAYVTRRALQLVGD